ncbi:sensor histidine kinase [Clostridium sp. AF18-27]|uniref:sensor histidine kinase n=1 Tax=Enterocloster lavalensis TaxID=460384 RepID=UPI000E4FBD9F|nr:HAMP domain-containing sensor histidine kinase [Enterocloster lavalensis]RHR48408.1 sensor histidine kinase [Clostridium sp. AF18-27]
MERYKKTKYNYSKLGRITFIRGLLITVGAVAAVLGLRMLTRGYWADAIVVWIARCLSISEKEADLIYFRIVTVNMQFILTLIIIIFVFLLFHMLLDTYKRYFDEVVTGIDKLMEERAAISLSPELESVERKLADVKRMLAERADKAKRAEHQKNDLVVYLAHDIKTPLTSVIGYLSLLDETPDMPDEEKAKYIHTAWEKANRLRTLVNEFFEITRSHSESLPIQKTKVDLYYMIAQISDELYPQLNACGKIIENHVGEDISVYGDSDKLARVFNNILKNAISYSEENSVIKVSARELSEWTVIQFENDGEIPEDKLNVIFDKFCRLSNARLSETGGSGLGLAIAKNIIVLHGGQIRAESSNGRTVFIIEIPSASSEIPVTAS